MRGLWLAMAFVLLPAASASMPAAPSYTFPDPMGDVEVGMGPAGVPVPAPPQYDTTGITLHLPEPEPAPPTSDRRQSERVNESVSFLVVTAHLAGWEADDPWVAGNAAMYVFILIDGVTHRVEVGRYVYYPTGSAPAAICDHHIVAGAPPHSTLGLDGHIDDETRTVSCEIPFDLLRVDEDFAIDAMWGHMQHAIVAFILLGTDFVGEVTTGRPALTEAVLLRDLVPRVEGPFWFNFTASAPVEEVAAAAPDKQSPGVAAAPLVVMTAWLRRRCGITIPKIPA